MSEDLPDWTRRMTLDFRGGLVGLEELAVRLGSIVPSDMQGNVVFMDDFEHAKPWLPEISGVGGSQSERIGSYQWAGAYAWLLLCGNDAGEYARAHYYTYHPGVSNYALFCRVAKAWNVGEFIFRARFQVEDIYTVAEVKVHSVNDEISIHADTGWVVVDTLEWYTWLGRFNYHPLRLDFDLENEKYRTLDFGHRFWDISGLNLYVYDNKVHQEELVISLENNYDGTGGIVIVDDVVLAKNLP